MSDSPVDPAQITQSQAVDSVAKDVVAGPKGAAAEGYASSQSYSSLADLKAKDPEMHKMMMESLARNIIDKMRRSQERFKKMMKEYRNR